MFLTCFNFEPQDHVCELLTSIDASFVHFDIVSTCWLLVCKRTRIIGILILLLIVLNVYYMHCKLCTKYIIFMKSAVNYKNNI